MKSTKAIFAAFAVASAGASYAQPPVQQFIGPLRCIYEGHDDGTPDNACVRAEDLGGEYVKSVTESNGTLTVTLQDATGTERTITFDAGTDLEANSVNPINLNADTEEGRRNFRIRLQTELLRNTKPKNEYLGATQDQQVFRVYQDDGTIGITSDADLDGDYEFVVKDQSALVPAINRGFTNELRMFILGSDNTGREIHSLDPYTFTADQSIVINVNVSAAEESLTRALLSTTPGRVRWGLAINQDNVRQALYSFEMPVNPNITPEGSGSEGVTPDQAKDIADQEILDTIEGLDIVTVASGTDLLTFLGRHENASEYGLAHFTRDTLQVYRTHTHNYSTGDVVLFLPGNIDPDAAEVLFTIPNTLGSLNVRTIESQAAFLAFLNGQEANTAWTLVHFPQTTQAERGAGLFDATAGEIALYPPHGVSTKKTLFTIPPATPVFTIYTSDWLRGILNTADLDGDYVLVVWDQARLIPQQYRPGSTTADPIDNLQLYVTNAGGDQFGVHGLSPYGYGPGPLVVPFNISVAEEGPASAALATTPGRVRFALQGNNQTSRQSGPFYSNMPINASFVPPAGGATVTYDSTAQPISDTAAGGDRDTVSRGDHIHELEVNADHFIFVGDTTLSAQASLINVDPPPFNTVLLSPGGISGDDMVKRVRVLLHERNPGTPSISNVQLSISGQTIALAESSGSPITPITGVATASRGELVFELTDAQVSAIGDNITGIQIDAEVTVTFAAASGRAAHVEHLTFGTNDPAFAAGIAPVAPSDTEIGGALAITSRGNWNEYTITEVIESGSLYQWEIQVGSDTRTGPSAIWRGQQLLEKSAQPNGSLTNADRDFLGVPSPRPDADGVRTLKFARHTNPLRIWVNVADPYNIYKLVKIGR